MFAPRRRLAVAFGLAVLVGLAVLAGCGGRVNTPAQLDLPADKTVELVFTFGSEKQRWLEEVTKAFNDQRVTVDDGKVVRVRLIPMGSGESMDAILGKYTPDDEKEKGADKPHLTSPASLAYVELANAEAKAAKQEPILDPATKKNLVLSPVVIATWKPMAEALGWPKAEVGWDDILALATDPKGWESKGKPQWGRFKFGHTHPDYSNSGLIAVLAETYAGAKKKGGLTAADVTAPATQEYVGKIEQAVSFYGRSTGFFGDRMVERGPAYLSAAVLYENMVIEANKPTAKVKPELPVVALYPKEGTFWSDHPCGVVNRPWVTDKHKQAADKYLAFLMGEKQQTKAMEFGFRPGDEKIALDPAVFNAGNGVDPKEPGGKVLEVPDGAVLAEVLKVWRGVKKPVRVTLVMDTSGSMTRDQKMVAAKGGATDFLDLLGDRDEVSLLTFSTTPAWAQQEAVKADKDGKEKMRKLVGELIPAGETALYDAIAAAHADAKGRLKGNAPDRVTAVVVLTDGADNKSKAKLDDLLDKIKYDAEGAPVRVFTIAYGADAQKDVLKKIADSAVGKQFEGTPQTIRRVLRSIFTDL
jgi:Ca-activated chloride channel family protein